MSVDDAAGMVTGRRMALVLVGALVLQQSGVTEGGPATVTAAADQLLAGRPADGCVVVTGANGFVAGHIVEVLLAKGYTVHGTMRDPSSVSKAQFLHDMAERLPGTLRLFKADLRDKRPFDEAAAGCWGFLHVASVVVPVSSDPQDMVRPSVAGTVAALEAAERAGVRAVVVTSSTSSVAPTKSKMHVVNATYDRSDYCDMATLTYGTYAYSKVQAERAGRQWVDARSGGPPFRYATVHFPWGMGPQQNRRVTSSQQLVKIMLSGEPPYPFWLPARIIVVDVRDVARAHVHILEHPRGQGRFIVAHDHVSSVINTGVLARTLGEELPNAPVPWMSLPVWFVKLLVVTGFNPSLDW